MTDASAIPPTHYADWFRRHAMTRGNSVAISTPRGRLTYAGFYRALHACARRLADANVEAGQTVAICVFNPTLACVLIAALNRMGCVPVSVGRPASPDARIPLPEALRVDRVLVEQPFEGVMPADAVDVHLDWLKVTGQETKEWQGRGLRDSDALAHIFTLPGPAGALRAVGLSTRQIEARIVKRSIGMLGAARTGQTLTQFAMRSSIGFQAAFSSFWAGGTIFIGFPEGRVAALIARDHIERIEGSPSQYREILRNFRPAQFDVSSLRAAVVVGGVAPAPLVAAIRNRLCRALLGLYGTVELGLIAFDPLRQTDSPGYRGHLVPWMQAEALDEDGRVLPAGSEGRLRFRCEEMVSLYLNDSAASAELFRGGWFYPGDTGTLSEERALTLSGRNSGRPDAGDVNAEQPGDDAPQQVVKAKELSSNETRDVQRGEPPENIPPAEKSAAKSAKKPARTSTSPRKPAKR